MALDPVRAAFPEIYNSNDAPLNDQGEIVGQAYDAVSGEFVAFVAIPR